MLYHIRLCPVLNVVFRLTYITTCITFPLVALALLFSGTGLAHEVSFSKSSDLKPRGISVEKKGRVIMLEATGRKKRHISIPLLMTDSGKQFVLRGETEDLQLDQYISVRGLLDKSATPFQTDGRLFVSGSRVMRSAKLRSEASGTKGVMVAFVSWSGSGLSGYGAYEGKLAELTSWSEELSRGKFRWDPVTRVNLVLPSPLTSNCDDQSWTSTVKNRLTALGYNLNDYRALGIALPQNFASSCVPTAYAYVSGGCTWGSQYWCGLSVHSYEYSDYATFVHELGHTLLLPHANQAPCEKGSQSVVLTYSGNCQHSEYGDRYDPMGTSFSNASYNPIFVDHLGWFPTGESVRIQSTPEDFEETFTLSPYGGQGGVRSLEVDLPRSPEMDDAFPGKLFVEYRADVGLDSILYRSDPQLPRVTCLSFTPRHNVFIRWEPTVAAANALNLPSPSFYGTGSYILDMTPNTSTTCDSGLAPGNSYTDPTENLTIQYLERASNLSSATVLVSKKGEVLPDPLIVDATIHPKQKNPTRNRKILFSLKGNRDIDEMSIDESDFKVSRGEVIYTERSREGYTVAVFGRSDGQVILSPSNTFSLRDLSGNLATKMNSVSVRLDTFISRPQLKLRPKKLTGSRKARFTWSHPEAVRFSCAIDNRGWRPCQRGKTYRRLSKGQHIFRVKAYDAAGNSKSMSYRWRIR
jgi:hypothetical protein